MPKHGRNGQGFHPWQALLVQGEGKAAKGKDGRQAGKASIFGGGAQHWPPVRGVAGNATRASVRRVLRRCLTGAPRGALHWRLLNQNRRAAPLARLLHGRSPAAHAQTLFHGRSAGKPRGPGVLFWT